jgi:hypothetical protein
MVIGIQNHTFHLPRRSAAPDPQLPGKRANQLRPWPPCTRPRQGYFAGDDRDSDLGRLAHIKVTGNGIELIGPILSLIICHNMSDSPMDYSS